MRKNIFSALLAVWLAGCTATTNNFFYYDDSEEPESGIITNFFPEAHGEIPVVVFMVHRIGGDVPIGSFHDLERKYRSGEYNIEDYFR